MSLARIPHVHISSHKNILNLEHTQCRQYNASIKRRRLPRLLRASNQPENNDTSAPTKTTAPAVTTADDPPSLRPKFRLFSNLGPDLRHEPGSVLGAATLVAGTAIGAGILALPAVCRPAGFVAASSAITLAAGFSILTGLLVAEVAVNTMCELGTGRGVSLGSMARRTLGEGGSVLVSVTYAVLHYALLVAYISKAGETLEIATGLPLPITAAAFTFTLGFLCYAARPTTLDTANSLLVGAVGVSFLSLMFTVAPEVQPSALLDAHWDAVPAALPIIALTFVYQNVVPVIASSLEGDVGKIRTAIVSGVGVPWLMFMLWTAAILGSAGAGIVSVGGDVSVAAAAGIEAISAAAAAGAAASTAATATAVTVVDPLLAIRSSGPLAGVLVDTFSILAIATSFIGFVLGLTEFVAEALQKPLSADKTLPYAATLLPPLALAVICPGLFYESLDFAGTYGVLVLFGLVTAAMVWSERYNNTTLTTIRVAPEGKLVLLGIGAAAGGVILDQLFFSSLG